MLLLRSLGWEVGMRIKVDGLWSSRIYTWADVAVKSALAPGRDEREVRTSCGNDNVVHGIALDT